MEKVEGQIRLCQSEKSSINKLFAHPKKQNNSINKKFPERDINLSKPTG
jgi:hypothetical protein